MSKHEKETCHEGCLAAMIILLVMITQLSEALLP